MSIGESQAAITKSAFTTSPIIHVHVDTQDIIVAWFEDYDTVAAFYADANNSVGNIADIDPYGNTANGKLVKANLYSKVPWMVWSHWYPETAVYQ